jgi:hypothetical protein
LLTPELIPSKFKESDFAPKYKIWCEKIEKVENTFDYEELLTKVVFAIKDTKESKITEPESVVVEPPKLEIDLSDEEDNNADDATNRAAKE